MPGTRLAEPPLDRRASVATLPSAPSSASLRPYAPGGGASSRVRGLLVLSAASNNVACLPRPAARLGSCRSLSLG